MSTEPTSTEPAGTGPIARLSVVALDTPDPQGLAAFYGAITGWPVDRDDGDWVQLRSSTGATIACQEAPDHVPPRWPDPSAPQQAHLDFAVADLAKADARVRALGARRTEWQPGEHQVFPQPFLVYLDPAGHPFCLVSEP